MADKIKAYEDKYWWSNDGLQLHYRDYPASPENAHRPPIICLHGLTRNARDFEDVALRLKGEWRLICVDFRGRGESAYAKDPLTYVPLTYMQDMEALLIEQKIEKFVALVHHWAALSPCYCPWPTPIDWPVSCSMILARKSAQMA